MATRLTQAQWRLLLGAVKAHADEYIEHSQGETNPQVIELRNKAQGRLELADAVLDAVNGCPVLLRILAS